MPWQITTEPTSSSRFWGLLEKEIGTRTWPGRATARAEVFTFIETFGNRRRLRKHKVFDHLSPAETRQRHQHALAAYRSRVRITGKLHLFARLSRSFGALFRGGRGATC
ncbi:hypothetical protein SSPIM334S_01159 [Streptomyces spiroverticillatus]